MNNGKAVRVQLDAPVQIVVIIASPAGRDVTNYIPTQATPIRAKPIQTELPSNKKRTNRNMTVA